MVQKPRYSKEEREGIISELEGISKLERREFRRLNTIWQNIYHVGAYQAPEKRIVLNVHAMDIITDVFGHSDADLREYTALITLIGLSGYIVKNCKKYTTDRSKFEDLINEAVLVIYNALETYDSSKGRLTTHLQGRIDKALEETMRRLDSGKITNRTQDDALKLVNKCRNWFKENGDPNGNPTPEMIAACAMEQFGRKIGTTTVVNALKYNRTVTSMDGEDDPTKTIAASSGNPESEFIRKETSDEFYRAVNRLNSMEQCVVYAWLKHYQEDNTKMMSQSKTLAMVKEQFPNAKDTAILWAMERVKKKLRTFGGKSGDSGMRAGKPVVSRKEDAFFQQEGLFAGEVPEAEEGFIEFF